MNERLNHHPGPRLIAASILRQLPQLDPKVAWQIAVGEVEERWSGLGEDADPEAEERRIRKSESAYSHSENAHKKDWLE